MLREVAKPKFVAVLLVLVLDAMVFAKPKFVAVLLVLDSMVGVAS